MKAGTSSLFSCATGCSSNIKRDVLRGRRGRPRRRRRRRHLRKVDAVGCSSPNCIFKVRSVLCARWLACEAIAASYAAHLFGVRWLHSTEYYMAIVQFILVQVRSVNAIRNERVSGREYEQRRGRRWKRRWNGVDGNGTCDREPATVFPQSTTHG